MGVGTALEPCIHGEKYREMVFHFHPDRCRRGIAHCDAGTRAEDRLADAARCASSCRSRRAAPSIRWRGCSARGSPRRSASSSSWTTGPAARARSARRIAAKANPDGYTFVFVFDTHAVNPSLIPNLPFDTVKDLAPVMLVGTAPMAVVTNAGKPYKSFGDVIKAAKAKPDSVTYGSIGSGSLGHLTMTLVQETGRLQARARSVQGRRSDDDRGAGRAGRNRHRQRRAARAAGEGRQAARARRHRRQALARDARRAGARGAGLSRLLGARVVGHLRAGRRRRSRCWTSFTRSS